MCVNLCASWRGRLAKMPNLYSHQRKHSQQDYLLKNRRGTALRISRTIPPTRLLAQKSKRHRSSNLESQTPNRLLSQKSKRHRSPNNESQTPNRIACSKIEEATLSNFESQIFNISSFLKTEEAPLSELREPDFLG
ncbi:hypothetical protein ACFX2C_022904 [Malus domestica]